MNGIQRYPANGIQWIVSRVCSGGCLAVGQCSASGAHTHTNGPPKAAHLRFVFMVGQCLATELTEIFCEEFCEEFFSLKSFLISNS